MKVIDGKKMLLGSEWTAKEEVITVHDPQDNSVFTTVPKASKEDVLFAIEEAKEGASISANLSVYERMEILHGVVAYIEQHADRFAETIASEGSKTITEAKGEVGRCMETIRLSAEEARRIKGETIPFSQREGSGNRVGYYYKFPIGIVAAITPFNDPLNLVAHKIGPAIASGNAIIVKPASLTPVSAILLAEAFEAAGLPKKILQVITGTGSEIGDTLVTHPAIRLVSFTGGLETGESIAKKAGLKKISMELGSNSPTIVLDDTDVDHAVDSCVAGAFGAVGQNCIGVQRVFISSAIYHEFVEKFVAKTETIIVGNKKCETTMMGPLIHEKEAKRIEKTVNEAIEQGGRLLTGGKREGAFYTPTVLANLAIDAPIAQEEIFGPVVLLFQIDSLDEAIEQANQVNYGLQAGIFTQNIEKAFKAIERLEVGGVLVNETSDFRIDAMPFGGIKGSGLGREGVQYAIEDMTEKKVVQFKL